VHQVVRRVQLHQVPERLLASLGVNSNTRSIRFVGPLEQSQIRAPKTRELGQCLVDF
jgi:hypothetical protein